MAEDQEDNKKPTLKDRAGFAVWEPKMEMYALEKGDQFGIFHEAGSDLVHNRYLDLPAPQKKVWLQTSKKLVGVIHGCITSEGLKQVFTTEYRRVAALVPPVVGADPHQPYIVRRCLDALAANCRAADVTTAIDTARTQFTLAVQGLNENKNFDDYPTGSKQQSRSWKRTA